MLHSGLNQRCDRSHCSYGRVKRELMSHRQRSFQITEVTGTWSCSRVKVGPSVTHNQSSRCNLVASHADQGCTRLGRTPTQTQTPLKCPHRQDVPQPVGEKSWISLIKDAPGFEDARSAYRHCKYRWCRGRKQLCRFTWASCARSVIESISSAPRLESNQCQLRGCLLSPADSAPKGENSEKKPCAPTGCQIRCFRQATQTKASTLRFPCEQTRQEGRQ